MILCGENGIIHDIVGDAWGVWGWRIQDVIPSVHLVVDIYGIVTPTLLIMLDFTSCRTCILQNGPWKGQKCCRQGRN